MAAPTTEVDSAPPAPPVPPRSHPPLGIIRRGVREIGLAFITLGIMTLLFVGYQLWGTGIAEAHSQASLKKDFQTELAKPTTASQGSGGGASSQTTTSQSGGGSDAATVGPAVPNVGPALTGAIDHMVIPKIGLNKYVVQGVAENDLREGPGHYTQTVLPGQKGNAGIAGHRTTYGAPFFQINKLTTGDLIYITNTSDQLFIYKVSRAPLVVSPSDVAVLDPTPYAQLTLTTCNPPYSATSRLVVFALLTNRPPLPAPKVVVAPTPATINLGSGDNGAWPAAIGYGAIVALLWIGVRLLINRTRRWTRVGAYAGGIGLCLIPLWFCFENVILLLPQNI
jgi:sortase A